jgi:hypothetical protein
VWLAVMLAALLVFVAPAAAQQSVPPADNLFTVDQVEALWPKLTPKQQLLAIDQLLKGGRYDVAGRLLDKTRYDFPGDQAIARFDQGMVARGQAREREAVAIFREVLAAHPEFTRVRLELAETLFAINEDDSARHNFELVLGGASANPGLQDAVRSYINAIDSRKRWDVTTFLTFAPSTNINQGSSSQTVMVNGLPFQLSDNNVATSGVGVHGGVQAGYRQPLTDGLDLVVTGGAQAKRYRQEEFNDTLLNFAIGPKWHFDRGYLGFYAVGDHRWMADSDYATSFGGLISGSVGLTAADVLSGDFGCSLRRFATDWQQTDLSYQDGHVCFVAARFDHYFDSSTYLRTLGKYGEELTGREHLDNTSKGGGLGVYHEFPLGLSLYLQGVYTGTDYKGIYPGFSEQRSDRRVDLSVNVTKRDFELFGLAPMVQYTYTHNDSNIPLQAYDAHGLALTLTKQF